MTLRPILHAARIAAAILFWPALTGVVAGSLVPEGIDVEVGDKLQHFAAYFVLAAIGASAARSRELAMLAVLALVLVGGAVEIAQIFVPGREASLLDALANTGGAVMGALAARLVVETLRARHPAPPDPSRRSEA